MPIVGLSDVDIGTARDETLNCYGPGGIYHEKQVGALCGLHSLNNLMQGPQFTVEDLRAVVQELDRRERELTDGQGLDYGNAFADGFYNVQVMQVVLSRAGLEMVPLKELPAEEPRQGWRRCRRRSRAEDIAREKAIILNKHKHWFALRRIGKEWFDLNSCLRAPHHLTMGDLREHIAEAMSEGYAVFVVRGIFPSCELELDRNKLKEAIKGCCQREGDDTIPEEFLPQHPWIVMLSVHFFGARQFDSFAPRPRRVQDEFLRRSLGDLRGRKLEHQGRAFSSSVLPSRAAQAPPEPNKLLHQRWPIFTLAQSFLAFTLCLSFSMLPSSRKEQEIGLESIFPGRTALLVHHDCEDFRAQVWRWLTYQFSHGSVSDAGMALMLTVTVGISLEGFWGPFWTALFFNAGILGGALFHMVMNPHVASFAGMYGGTYSLIGFHLADALLNWRSRRFIKLKLCLILGLVSLDQTHLLASRASASNFWSVAAVVQGGGVVTGLILGFVLSPNPLGYLGERLLLGTSLAAGFAILAFWIAWIAQWPPRSPAHTTPWCWARQVYNASLFGGDGSWHCVRCQDKPCIERWSRQRQIQAVDFNACDSIYGWKSTER